MTDHLCAALPRRGKVLLLTGESVCICSWKWFQECLERERYARRLAVMPAERRAEQIKLQRGLARVRLSEVVARLVHVEHEGRAAA